jgi:TolB protein
VRDAKDLLKPLDQLEPPDLWREASARTPSELPAGPPSRSARVAAVLVSAVIAVAGMVLVIRAFADGPNTRPGGDVVNGKIAVAREGCEGDVFLCREPAHIVLVNPDGSGERDIGEGTTPAWSPDGSRLAYTAGNAGAIYVADADGARQTLVVSCDEPDCVSVMSPSWSPDGTQLTFTAEHTGRSGRDPEVDIWVVNADGTDAHAVTACRRPDCSSNFAPAWSPVGDEIAMWSMVRCGDEWGPSLRLLDLLTGDIRDVVSCVGSNGSRIAWSPDGRSLAFELDTGNGTGNIFTITASGGSSTQVTSCDRTDCRWAYYPSWSPDGRWLLFAVKSEPEAMFEVAKARPDGGEFQRLGIQGFMPAWQPVPVDENDATPTLTVGEGFGLEAEGTSLTLPPDWNGRADPLTGYTHPIIQAATFPLPALDDIEATDARAAIGPEDVLIVLEEFTALCPPCQSESSGLPILLGEEDFEDPTRVPKWLPPLTDVPPDHALARRSFNVGPRYFDLRIEFGSAPARDDLLAEVNEILATLSVGEWVPEPNGICQWNEIGMRDPDCPQTQWLREVLTKAGFGIDAVGGSWVARSDSVEFFVWVEEADAVSDDHLALLEDADAFPVRENVRGVTVYGNDEGWEWRTGRVHLFVRQGPDGDSRLPTLEGLTPLVVTSLEVPYPPELA